MLCYRCGSHVQDGAEKCWNCGTVLADRKKDSPSTAELRARQRTGSRMFGVVYKIGDLIANRYRVKDIVGSGGAGVVYRARDQEIDVDVAVKVVNAKLVQTSDEQRLFSRQTKIARKLSHQNVVRIYDEGRDEQRPYFTMQFLEGLSMRKIIDLRKEKKQTFALNEIEPIFNQLCQALDYAHKTTFHGNMKPDNVIVLPDLLKITDFALLRGLPRKPFLAIQKSRGTNFRYLAPEVRLEVPDLEKSVDIYSLGVILCEMLTGLVYDEAKAEALTAAGSGLDPSVMRMLKRSVSRAPKDRYRTARDLYEDIRSSMSKNAAGRRNMPPPPPEQHPAHAAEAPTQRLDITKHGASPVDENNSAAADKGPKAAAVEVSTHVDLGDEAEDTPPREATASFEIDDDMIEASEAHKSQRTAGKRPQPDPDPKAASKSIPPPVPVPVPEPEPKEAELGASPAVEDDGLQDDPDGSGDMDEEEPTIAAMEPEPELAAAAILPPGLEEISSSSIELIADPSATNLMRVDREKSQVEPVVVAPPPEPVSEQGSNGAEHQTVQPTPLPDSAIPEPAFASIVSQDQTQHGRLDGPEPDLPSEPAPAPVAESRTPKKRPMTRPRMATVQPTPMPVVSTMPGGAASARPQTMPAAAGLGTIPPATAPVAPPPNNRPLYFTVAAAIGTVLLALLVVLKVSCDQREASDKQIAALEQRMTQMQGVAKTARSNQQKLEGEAEAQGKEAQAAQKAEDEAKAAAEAEKQKKAEAEAEAARVAAEAQKARAAAEAADAQGRAEAEKKAEAAKLRAQESRAAAEAAAAREAAANKRAEAQRARRETAQRKKEEKEQRAREEAAAARKAEARAERLAEERRLRREAEDSAAEDRAAAAAKKREAEQARAEAEKRRKAEAAAAAAAAAKKAAEAEKAAEAKAMTARNDAPATQTCPKGMVMVPGGAFMMGSARNDPERNFGDQSYSSVDVGSFCVDYYEYPNGRGLTPKAKVSYNSASSRCKRKGKRLCTEPEWEKACKGKAGTRYPYGNQWDPARCNTEDDEGSDREVAKSGTFRRCYSGFKVFDMSGNVAEWTSTKWGSGHVVKGGASDRPGYDGRCAARKKKKSGASQEGLGFRCCADPK